MGEPKEKIRLGAWIQAGYETVVRRGFLWHFVLMSVIMAALVLGQQLVLRWMFETPEFTRDMSMRELLVQSVFSMRGLFGTLLSGIIFGLGQAGIYAIVLHFMRTGEFRFVRATDIFAVVGSIVALEVVVGLMVQIGAFFCLIPGLIVFILYTFAMLLVVDKRMHFWEAMEASRKMVTKYFISFSGFFFIQLGIFILGLLACGVGVLVSFPIVLCSTAAAYRELWPENEASQAKPIEA